MHSHDAKWSTRIVVGLAVVAFAVYFLGSWWGIPTATGPDRVRPWGIDDESPLGPLSEIHNIIQPKTDQWLSYPLMYYFVTAAAYAPYMLVLFLTGSWTSISATYPFGLTDPVNVLRTLTFIAHLVSVVMATCAVVAIYSAAKTVWDQTTGVVAGLLALVSFPLIYYARNGNVDAMTMGFVSLATAVYSRMLVAGISLQRAVLLGVFVGFGLATKESSLGVFIAMPIAILLNHIKSRPEPNRTHANLFKTVAPGALAGVVAFGLGSGLFIDPDRYLAHIRYLRSLLELVSQTESPSVYAYPYTLSGHYGYLLATGQNLIDALSTPGLLLAGVGLCLAFKHRPAAGLALLSLTFLVFSFLSYRLVQVRYLMPVTLLLLPFVASAIVTFARIPAPSVRLVGIILAVWILGRSTLVSIDLTYQMLFDSRYAAARWLAAQTGDGDSVEFFGPASNLPALKPGVTARVATEFRGLYTKPRIDAARAQEIVRSWRERNPKFIIIMPDYTSHQPAPYSRTLPPQVYQGLEKGEYDYKLVAFFETPALFPWMRKPLLDYPVVNPPIRIFASGEMARAITAN